MIGFLVRGRVRIKIRIRVRVGVMFMFIVKGLPLEQFSPEQMSYILEALILILEKVLHCRYDLIIGPILLPSQVFFSCWETEIDGAKSGEYGG